MSAPVSCRHRRPRPLLQALFVLAVAIIAHGYGQLAGVAHGYADAVDTAAVSCPVPERPAERP